MGRMIISERVFETAKADPTGRISAALRVACREFGSEASRKACLVRDMLSGDFGKPLASHSGNVIVLALECSHSVRIYRAIDLNATCGNRDDVPSDVEA